jgi:hypothetical protein
MLAEYPAASLHERFDENQQRPRCPPTRQRHPADIVNLAIDCLECKAALTRNWQ